MINGSSIVGTNGTFAVTKGGNKTFTYPVTGVTSRDVTISARQQHATRRQLRPSPRATSHGLSNGMTVEPRVIYVSAVRGTAVANAVDGRMHDQREKAHRCDKATNASR